MTGGAVTAATVATNDIFKINGETIIDGSSDAGVVISASDSDFMLSTRINSVSHLTGVTAELDAGKLKMTAADGRNILVDVANLTETGFGNVFGSTNVNAANQAAGKVTLYSSDLIELNVTNEDVLELATQNVAVDRVNNRVDKIDVTTFESANNAIRIIDSALEDITNAQAQLGALSNRLVNTVDNLAVSIENMQASRSRIMDADFALETSNLTRAQILQQSGTAVLAQANLKPQAALSLLG